MRGTKDVDVVVDAPSKPVFDDLEAEFRRQGYKPDLSDEPPVICRWLVEGVQVDIMPSGGSLGFQNRWYPDVVDHWFTQKIGDQTIRIVTAPYFLATKIEAYRNREIESHLESIKILASHDLEDIVAVFNGRPEIMNEIAKEPKELGDYISEFARELILDDQFEEAVEDHLHPERDQKDKVISMFEQLAAL